MWSMYSIYEAYKLISQILQMKNKKKKEKFENYFFSANFFFIKNVQTIMQTYQHNKQTNNKQSKYIRNIYNKFKIQT